jgi:hypothetical protein
MQFDPETCHKTIQSPWGSLTLAANPKGLSGIWFENPKGNPTPTQRGYRPIRS